MRVKFEEGDRVICVRDNFIDTETGKPYILDPKKNDRLTVSKIWNLFGVIYLEFEEIPNMRGEPEIYIAIAFRKIPPEEKFTNDETARLVEDFKEQEKMRKQLQEDELKIFTTGADF